MVCTVFPNPCMQHNTLLVLCVCRYSTLLALYSVYAGQYIAGLVLCVCNTVGDQPCTQCMHYNTLLALYSVYAGTVLYWPCTQCMQDNTLLALYSVYATQSVTSLILSVCTTIHY